MIEVHYCHRCKHSIRPMGIADEEPWWSCWMNKDCDIETIELVAGNGKWIERKRT